MGLYNPLYYDEIEIQIEEKILFLPLITLIENMLKGTAIKLPNIEFVYNEIYNLHLLYSKLNEQL